MRRRWRQPSGGSIKHGSAENNGGEKMVSSENGSGVGRGVGESMKEGGGI